MAEPNTASGFFSELAVLVTELHTLIKTWITVGEKASTLLDSANGCVVDLEADADKVTDAVKAFKIKVF